MNDEYEHIEIRSEEVQEILGTPPSWLTQWGTVIALIGVSLLGWAGYWVKYPDLVEAKIKVYTSEPPAKMVAKNTAFLTDLLVEQEDTVEADQVLAVFSPKASYSDVMVLDDQIFAVKDLSDSSLLAFRPYKDLLLGNLQKYLDDFTATQETLSLLNSGRLERLSTREKRRRINLLKSEVEDYRKAGQTLQDQIDLESHRFKNEKELYKKETVTLDELRTRQNSILSLQREKATLESAIKSKQYEADLLERQVGNIRRDSKLDREAASEELSTHFKRLRQQLQEWKNNYLVISPIKGIVVFNKENLREQDFVDRGDELMTVLPVGAKDIIGRISLPLEGSGKVREDQRVLVKFNSYPFHEFGAVEGVITRKGRIPTEEAIPLEVAFPNGLRTSADKQIEITQEMTGTAEIVTEDKRLIERIFLSFRRFVS